MLNSEQLVEIHDLMKKVYDTEPNYVVLSITYSTDQRKDYKRKRYMKLNLYTPIMGHNEFNNIEDFLTFLIGTTSLGSIDMRYKLLVNRLRAAESGLAHAEEELGDTKTEIKKLKELREFEVWQNKRDKNKAKLAQTGRK